MHATGTVYQLILPDDSTLRNSLARKYGPMSNFTGFPDVSAQSRTFVNGESRAWYGDV